MTQLGLQVMMSSDAQQRELDAVMATLGPLFSKPLTQQLLPPEPAEGQSAEAQQAEEELND
ncbi:hypothetical protein HaLaN_27985, partial [Haematococcus lacustris]